MDNTNPAQLYSTHFFCWLVFEYNYYTRAVYLLFFLHYLQTCSTSSTLKVVITLSGKGCHRQKLLCMCYSWYLRECFVADTALEASLVIYDFVCLQLLHGIDHPVADSTLFSLGHPRRTLTHTHTHSKQQLRTVWGVGKGSKSVYADFNPRKWIYEIKCYWWHFVIHRQLL